MPRHCKELMMLRMHCMRDAYVMQFEEEYDLVHGKVMFAIKDSRDFVVFDVSIPSTQQEIEDAKMKAHEHMLILSNHYLTSILDREANDFLDNRCHLLGAVCPQHVLYNNECPQCENPPVPFQNVRNGYRIGTHLVNTRDASWGSITNEKYIIAHRDDQNKMMTRYVIGYGCEVLDEDGLPLVLDEILTQDSSFEYELKTEHTFKHPRVSYKLDKSDTIIKQFGVVWRKKGSAGKLTFYSYRDLYRNIFLTPVTRPVYPTEIGQEVVTIGFPRGVFINGKQVENDVWGKVVEVKNDELGTKVKVLLEDTELVERIGDPACRRTSFMTSWQKSEKFLVQDNSKYMDEAPVNEASEPVLYKFEIEQHNVDDRSLCVSQTCAWVKALFEMESGPLIHWSENLKEKNTTVSLTRDMCDDAKRKIEENVLLHDTSVTSMLDSHKVTRIIEKNEYKNLRGASLILILYVDINRKLSQSK